MIRISGRRSSIVTVVVSDKVYGGVHCEAILLFIGEFKTNISVVTASVCAPAIKAQTEISGLICCNRTEMMLVLHCKRSFLARIKY
jgi:hypothetical protein